MPSFVNEWDECVIQRHVFQLLRILFLLLFRNLVQSVSWCQEVGQFVFQLGLANQVFVMAIPVADALLQIRV